MSPLPLHTFSKQSFWCAKDGIPKIYWLLESLCFGCFIHQFYDLGSVGNWKLQIAGEIVDYLQIYHENCHATYYVFWSDILLDHGRKNFQNHMKNMEMMKLYLLTPLCFLIQFKLKNSIYALHGTTSISSRTDQQLDYRKIASSRPVCYSILTLWAKVHNT